MFSETHWIIFAHQIDIKATDILEASYDNNRMFRRFIYCLSVSFIMPNSS